MTHLHGVRQFGNNVSTQSSMSKVIVDTQNYKQHNWFDKYYFSIRFSILILILIHGFYQFIIIFQYHDNTFYSINLWN